MAVERKRLADFGLRSERVLWQGKPLADAEVVLLVPNQEKPVEGKSDADGKFILPREAAGKPGLYGLRARHVEKKDGGTVLYSERSHESYARSFELPQAVDSAKAEAKFENGVLTLTLPKKDAPKTARVTVQ